MRSTIQSESTEFVSLGTPQTRRKSTRRYSGLWNSEHCYSIDETLAFTHLINNTLSGDELVSQHIPLSVENEDLFKQLDDGLILMRLINTARPGSINTKKFNKSINMNIFQKQENLSTVLIAAKQIGCSIVNMGGEDILAGRPTLILGLLWQIIKILLLNKVASHLEASVAMLKQQDESDEVFMKLSSEQVLLRWVSHHLEKAGEQKVVLRNFDNDMSNNPMLFCKLLHQINHQCIIPAVADNMIDPLEVAESVIHQARSVLKINTFIQPSDLIGSNSKLIMGFVAQLYDASNSVSDNPHIDIDEDTIQDDDYIYIEDNIQDVKIENHHDDFNPSSRVVSIQSNNLEAIHHGPMKESNGECDIDDDTVKDTMYVSFTEPAINIQSNYCQSSNFDVTSATLQQDPNTPSAASDTVVMIAPLISLYDVKIQSGDDDNTRRLILNEVNNIMEYIIDTLMIRHEKDKDNDHESIDDDATTVDTASDRLSSSSKCVSLIDGDMLMDGRDVMNPDALMISPLLIASNETADRQQNYLLPISVTLLTIDESSSTITTTTTTTVPSNHIENKEQKLQQQQHLQEQKQESSDDKNIIDSEQHQQTPHALVSSDTLAEEEEEYRQSLPLSHSVSPSPSVKDLLYTLRRPSSSSSSSMLDISSSPTFLNQGSVTYSYSFSPAAAKYRSSNRNSISHYQAANHSPSSSLPSPSSSALWHTPNSPVRDISTTSSPTRDGSNAKNQHSPLKQSLYCRRGLP